MTKEYKKRMPQETTHFQVGADAANIAISYRPVPKTAVTPYNWRVYFEILSEPSENFGLDIQGELFLGRDVDQDNVVDLTTCGAAEHGVSRRHAMLRPTVTNLFLIDQGSTNGTTRNGRSIGVKTPYPVVNGDVISLGGLRLALHIVDRPSLQEQTAQLRAAPDLTEALSQIAKAITSQLNLDEVLNQVAETAMLLTAAGETGIWLVDERTGELFLEAERGVEDDRLRRMRLPIGEDTLAGRVIQSGRPLRTSRKEDGDPIKLKTNYLVEALVYVPIKLGGVTLGVLSAVHRQPGKQFQQRDERLLAAIADFAAIAIQNARLYQATDKALALRVKELIALNELSHTVSASLDLNEVYKVLVEQVSRNWEVGGVGLYLLDERENVLRPISNNNDKPANFHIDHGILWETCQRREPMVANNLSQQAQKQAGTDNLPGQPFHAIASVPLLVQDKVVGVVALFNKQNGRFLDEDVERLQAFANPLATAIKNARLFAESERQRRAILATARTLTQPLLILDESGAVLIANEAAQAILDQHMSPLFQGISRGVGRTIEMEIGKNTYLSTSQHMPDVGTIVIMQDITYVKQLEKDRTDFLHALSHDLKSPLTSIAGYAQLLQHFMPQDDKAKHYLRQVLAASDRMLDMINQLLLVAKGDAIELQQIPCELNDIVAQVVADVEGSALNKRITVSQEINGQPVKMLGDPTRLYHLALNLVDNAIKYSPEQTTVLVKLAYAPENVTFYVQDQGPGIPPKDLPRIFDKYYRGSQAQYQPGAGLGLSVVWAIAEAHDGHASVQNGAEGGAIFTVVLPLLERPV
jgi:two-component system, OmpR family, phosphate regulon sensor histidine kinase PhoR